MLANTNKNDKANEEMRAEEGVSYLALRKRNQVFHKGEAAADLGLEEQQVELRLHEILQDVNQLRVQILKKLSISSDNLAPCHVRAHIKNSLAISPFRRSRSRMQRS